MRVHTLVATAIALASFAVAGCASDVDDPMTEQEVRQPSGTSSIAGPIGDLDKTTHSTKQFHATAVVGSEALEGTLVPASPSGAKPVAENLDKAAFDTK